VSGVWVELSCTVNMQLSHPPTLSTPASLTLSGLSVVSWLLESLVCCSHYPRHLHLAAQLLPFLVVWLS